MATKSSKSTDQPTQAGEPEHSAAKVSSKQAALDEHLASRNKFVALAALAAIALLAISFGMVGYHRPNGANNKSTTVVRNSGQQGKMYLKTPDAKASLSQQNLSVTLYEDSGSQPVNSLQSAIRYPSDKLQLVSVKGSGNFPMEAATDTSTPGLIRLARGLNSQTAPLTGARPVVTLEFKVLQSGASSAELSIDQASSLLVRSTDNQNILQAGTGATLKLQ